MAGNLLGSIGLEMYANTVGFESDLGRAAQITKRQTDQMVKTLGRVAGVLGVSLGVGAFANFLKGAIDTQDAVDEMAQSVGVSTEAMSRLRVAAKFTATDVDGVGKVLKKLGVNSVEAATGNKVQAAAFKQLGIEVKTSTGQLKTADVLLGEIAGKFEHYADGPGKTAMAIKLLGKSGADMVPLLNLGAQGMKDMADMSDRLGLTVSTASGAMAGKFKDNLDVLGFVSEGVGNKIAQALTPALVDLTDKAVAFFMSDDWQNALKAIGDGAQWAVDHIDLLVTGAKIMAELFIVRVGINAVGGMLSLAKSIGDGAKAALKAQAALGTMAAQAGASAKTVGGIQSAMMGLNASLGIVMAAFAGWQIGTMLREQFVEVRLFGIAMVEGLLVAWENLKSGTELVWLHIKKAVSESIVAVRNEIADLLDAYSDFAQTDLFTGKKSDDTWSRNLAASIRPAATAATDYAAAIKKAEQANKDAVAGVREITGGLADYEISAELAKQATAGAADGVREYVKNTKDGLPAVKDNTEAQKKLNDEWQKANELTAKLGGDNLLPMAKANADAAASIEQVKKQHEALMLAAVGAGDATDQAARANKWLDDSLRQVNRTLEETKAQLSLRGNAYLDIAKQSEDLAEQLGYEPKMWKAVEQAQRDVAKAQEEGHDLNGVVIEDAKVLADVLRQQKPGYIDQLQNLTNQREAMQLAVQAGESYRRMWQDVGRAIEDSFTGALSDAIQGIGSVKDAFKAAGRTMVQEAADIVARIIVEFGKLALIKFVTGQGGGLGSLASQAFSSVTGLGGSSALGSSANAGGGFSFSNLASAGSTIWKGFSAGASAFTGQGVGGLFNASNWATAGSNIMSGFTSGLTNVFPGLSSMFGGAGTMVLNSPLATSGISSLAGGTTNLGYAQVTNWGSSTAQVGSNVGTATAASGNAMTAMLSNPVTWILAGMAASSKFYDQGWRVSNGNSEDTLGGKLGMVTNWADGLLQSLGMSGKAAAIISGSSLHTRIFGRGAPTVQSSAMNFGFSDAGATGGVVAQVKEKGGWLRSDKRYTKDIALDEETRAMIDSLFAGFRNGIEMAGASLGIKAPAMVESSIKQNFDKSGKLVDTIVTVLGRQWKESVEDGIIRIGAENIIAAVGVSASNASEIAEQWRGSAALLAEGAQFLLAAQSDINAGVGLLDEPTAREDVGQGSLSAVTILIQDLQAEGETLTQTYARAVAATGLLDTAVALMGVNLGKGREDFVRFAVGIQEAAAAAGKDAGALFSDYFNRFYSQAERAQMALDQATTAGGKEFADIGLSLADYTGDGGAADFRRLFEERMPTLTAEATVQWLEAANALGVVIDVSAELVAATGTAATEIARTAEQIQTVADILASNDKALAQFGMSDAQKAVADLQEQYADQLETLKVNAATAKELAIWEEQRGRAMLQQYEAFVGQFADGPDTSTLAGQIESIRQWEAAQIAAAETYAIGAGMEGAAATDLANIHRDAAEQIAAAQVTFQDAYDQFVSQFKPDTALATGAEAGSMADAYAQSAAWVQAQLQTASDLAVAAGMSGANAEDVLAIWAASDATIASVQARLDQAYKDIVGTWAMPVVEPANLAESTAQISAWMDEQIAAATEAAQAAGMQGIAESDLALIHENAAAQIAAAAARYAEAFQDYRDFLEGIRRETLNLSDFQLAMLEADDWRDQAIATANEHARAAGLAGASEAALALIERRASQMRAAAIAQLRQETQSLIDQLYNAGDGLGEGMTTGIEDAANAAADFWANQRQQIDTLQGWLDANLLGDLSPLNAEQQLAEAYRQMMAAIESGDGQAATQLADAYLRMFRNSQASGDDFNAEALRIRALIAGMLASIGATEPPETGGSSGAGGGISPEEAEALAAGNRLELAAQLAQHLADLSAALGQPIFELMESLGVDLRRLTHDLGIDLQHITGESVLSLANMADMLGVNLTDLTGELGLSLHDLGAGITELAAGMGIDLQALTSESAAALGTLANQLGLDLGDLAASVGVDLGTLADDQSLLNDALENTINGLPTGTRDQLRPLLEAVENATTEADANAALAVLEDAVNLLAPDIRNALAPYFANVFPVDALTDLDFLSGIDNATRQTKEIADQQLAQLWSISNHAGEMVQLLQRIADEPTSQAGSMASAPESGSMSAMNWTVPDAGTSQTGEAAAIVSELRQLAGTFKTEGGKTRDAIQTAQVVSDANNDRSLMKLRNNSRSLASA